MSPEHIDALYRTAEAAEAAGNLELACAQYRNLLEQPGLPAHVATASRYRLGFCLQQTGDLSGAIHEFQAAFASRSAWPSVGRQACWEMTGLLLRAGDFEAAERGCHELSQELDCSPVYRPELRFRWIYCLIRLKRPEGLEEARRMCEDLPHIDFAGFPGALNSLFEVGISIELAGDYGLAARFYSALLEREHLHPHALAGASYRLAICLEGQGFWEESMPYYRMATELGTGLPAVPALARAQLGLLLLAAEEYEEAAKLYAELQAFPEGLNISLAEVQYRLAFCLYHADRVADAERVLRDVSISDATNEISAKIDHLLAEIFEGRREYRAAVACYQRIISNSAAEIPVKASALQRVNALRASEA